MMLYKIGYALIIESLNINFGTLVESCHCLASDQRKHESTWFIF